MSFETIELNFRRFRPKPKFEPESSKEKRDKPADPILEFKSDKEERDKPVDPILENELEEVAKQQADILLEQAELEKALVAAEQRETTPATELRKAAKPAEPRETAKPAESQGRVALTKKEKNRDELFDDRKDYLGPQRYDLAAWKKYYKKKKKIV
ncbi:MAG: hypothetical protein Q8N57_03880 [bacterium]|nr:hypothetical protein [bacterium]